MRKAVFITIRKDSTRLQNKALMVLMGQPVIQLVIKRARIAQKFDAIVVCTTDRPIDDDIAHYAELNGVSVYRGSLKDKLERWNGAAQKYGIDYVVTFDGDDLFTDPELLDKGADQIADNEFDFLESPKGLVPGAFTYAFSTTALKKVCEIKDTDDTEMMWTYFKDTGLFRCGCLKSIDKELFRDYRLTLDYEEDYAFFKAVYEHFKCANNDVPLKKILKYLDDNPEIANINMFRHVEFLENQKRKTKLITK